MNQKALNEKYKKIHELLAAEYGEPTWRQHLPPVDELANTILSQNTSDVNRDKAFEALTAKYPTWQMVMEAPDEAVIETIRPAGLANQKGPRIQNALRELQAARGELSLDFLSDLPLAEAKKWLTDLKGVGPKTAAIVLLFGFGRPAFPVDTHVHRVSGLLGLIGPKVTADKAHKILENIPYYDTFYGFHLNMIRHGREVCTARNPNCPNCVLNNICDYYVRTVND